MLKRILFCALCAIPLVFLPSCKKAASMTRSGQSDQKLGKMSISSEPAGAEIAILGKVLDDKTPYETNPVPEAMCSNSWISLW